ncbi:MAG: PaaI family thioesterase [Chloroflexi bacterium]|nr:PaaI family thioesterase [Chloroflexota bacterium]
MLDKRLERCQAIIEMCNTSPYYRLLGIEVIEMREGYCRLMLPAEEKHHHPGRVVHGGAIVSALDSVGALAGLSALDLEDELITAEIKVNFLSAVKAGDKMIAEGRVVHRGRTLVLSEMEARTEDGRLIAKALTTCAVLKGQNTLVKHEWGD